MGHGLFTGCLLFAQLFSRSLGFISPNQYENLKEIQIQLIESESKIKMTY
jgi:hypothetical protein